MGGPQNANVVQRKQSFRVYGEKQLEKKVKQDHTSLFTPEITLVSIVTLGKVSVGVRRGHVPGVHGNKGSILWLNL